jgi:hypothetical protein
MTCKAKTNVAGMLKKYEEPYGHYQDQQGCHVGSY